MALFNLLLIPILMALGLFETNGAGAGDGGAGGNAGAPDQPAAGAGGAAAGAAAGSAGSGAAQPAGGASGAPAAGAAGAKPAAGGQAPPAPQAGTQLADVERLQNELNQARADAGKYRAAGIQAIAEALGIELPKLKGDDDQASAITQLQTEITSLRDEAKRGAIDATFERVVGQLGAKPVLTRRYIEAQLKDLDPKAADFSDKIKAIVQAAIDEEPALKAAQAAARSGGEFNGGAGEDGDKSQLSIDDLRKERAGWRGVPTTPSS